MYWFRFATRCCTSPSCPWLICQNSEPHTGISRFPCAGSAASPEFLEFQCLDSNNNEVKFQTFEEPQRLPPPRRRGGRHDQRSERGGRHNER